MNAPISAPVNVCGIAAAVVGFAHAACRGGAASNTVIAGSGGSGGNGNAGVISALSGNTVNAPISAPVNVCGVAAGVVGYANAQCAGGSFSNTIIPPNTPPTGPTMPPTTPTTPPTGPTTPPTGPTTPPTGPTTPPTGPTTPPTGPTTPPTGPTTPPTGPTTPPTGPTTPPTGPTTPPTGPTTGSMPSSGSGVTTSTAPGGLPITGADLAGLAAVALGSLGIGATTMVVARRRRRNEAA